MSGIHVCRLSGRTLLFIASPKNNNLDFSRTKRAFSIGGKSTGYSSKRLLCPSVELQGKTLRRQLFGAREPIQSFGFTSAQATQQRTVPPAMPSILWIGISSYDPDIPLPPGVDPKALDAQLDDAVKETEGGGYKMKLFQPLLADGMGGLKEEIRTNNYDAIIVGVGLRTLKPLLPFFEDIVNACREAAPSTKIGFNASIDTTLAAAQRACPL